MYLSTFILFDNSSRWKNIVFSFRKVNVSLFSFLSLSLSLSLSVFFSLFVLLARVHMHVGSRGGNWLVWKKYSAFLFSLSFRCKRVKSREGFKVQEDNLNAFSGRLALIKNAAREKIREKIHSAKIPRVL